MINGDIFLNKHILVLRQYLGYDTVIENLILKNLGCIVSHPYVMDNLDIKIDFKFDDKSELHLYYNMDNICYKYD